MEKGSKVSELAGIRRAPWKGLGFSSQLLQDKSLFHSYKNVTSHLHIRRRTALSVPAIEIQEESEKESVQDLLGGTVLIELSAVMDILHLCCPIR